MHRFLSKLCKYCFVSALVLGAAPVQAQNLLQDLDPGSLTEGVFVDIIYHPEPAAQNAPVLRTGANAQRSKKAVALKSKTDR